MICVMTDPSVLSRLEEFEGSFTYAALVNTTESGGPSLGPAETVTVVTYNRRSCPTIPDFGSYGFMALPASPAISVRQERHQIEFEVIVPYVRNHTAWRTPALVLLHGCLLILFTIPSVIDFIDLDGRPGVNPASTIGGPCSNRDDSPFVSLPFNQWYRARDSPGIHSPVQSSK